MEMYLNTHDSFDAVLPMFVAHNTACHAHFQHTLKSAFVIEGIGVHSGLPATMVVKPAPANIGYVFVRTDVPSDISVVRGLWSHVYDTASCTRLTNAHGTTISTVEHILAALIGSDIDNAVIEIDGPEIPIMDGSAQAFIDAIKDSGLIRQNAQRRITRVLKPVEVVVGDSYVRLLPADEPSYGMVFNAQHRLPETQNFSFAPWQDDFAETLANARTFGFYEDAERLWAAGLAKGSSLDNSVILKNGKIMNPHGLRSKNEFVRHKILDAVGDLALAEGCFVGRYEAYNAGHRLNNMALRALYSDSTAFEHNLTSEI